MIPILVSKKSSNRLATTRYCILCPLRNSAPGHKKDGWDDNPPPSSPSRWTVSSPLMAISNTPPSQSSFTLCHSHYDLLFLVFLWVGSFIRSFLVDLGISITNPSFHVPCLCCPCLFLSVFLLVKYSFLSSMDWMKSFLGYLQADNDYYYGGGGRKGRADRHGDKWDAVGDLNWQCQWSFKSMLIKVDSGDEDSQKYMYITVVAGMDFS